MLGPLVKILRATICSAALVGCGSDEPDDSKRIPPNSSTITDDCEGRAEEFSAGMKKTTGSGYTIELRDANPAPPRQGNNTWQLAVYDASNAPVSGAQLSVDLWMPDHNHGSNTVPAQTELGNGQYQLMPLFLSMPGLWEITLSVEVEPKESVTFAFCVPGSSAGS